MEYSGPPNPILIIEVPILLPHSPSVLTPLRGFKSILGFLPDSGPLLQLAAAAPAYPSYVSAHRPLSSSFLGLPYRILNINHKKEPLRGRWVKLDQGSESVREALHVILS